MTLRLAKVALVAAVAFFYTLVVFNNLTDYVSNCQFVHHVLLMDTTFPGNHGMWRAIHSPLVQTIFYDGIIAWEAVVTVLSWIGVVHAAATSPWQQPITTLVEKRGCTCETNVWLVSPSRYRRRPRKQLTTASQTVLHWSPALPPPGRCSSCPTL